MSVCVCVCVSPNVFTSLLLGFRQLLNNQQLRGVNFTLSSDMSKQKTDPRANMALCVWEALEQRVIIN